MAVNPEVSRQMIEDLYILAGNEHYAVWHMCPDSCERAHFDPALVAEQIRLAMGEIDELRAKVVECDGLYHASRANNEQAMAMLSAKDVEIADLAGWCRYALANWAPSGSDKAEAMQASLDKAVKP